jgi:hypothetical protein
MTTITGAIKFVDVPNDFCISNITDLIKFIQKTGKIEFNASQVTNVSVSVDQPADTTTIWFKLSPSGNFVGVFIYIQSAWRQMFPVPNGVYRMYGDSTDIPAGYALITNTTPGFTAAMVTHLQGQWLQDPTLSFYVIFDVVYVGL